MTFRAGEGRRLPRLRFVPLVILLVLVIVATGIGGTTVIAMRSQNSRPAAIATTPASGGTAAICRPPVATPADQPWLDGDASAERTWEAHRAELSTPYFTGPNGWLFYNDQIDDYASQAVGRRNLTSGEVERWVDYLDSVASGLKKQGIEFYIVPTPSTTSVYPEELPGWMRQLRGSTSLDQFLAASGNLPVIDLRQDLIEAKASAKPLHLYSWDNSHWTDYGGYIGWKQIARCIDAHNPDDADVAVPAISGARIVGDFNEFAPHGAASPGSDWAAPEFTAPLQKVTVTRASGGEETVDGARATDSTELPLTTSVPRSSTGKSALIVRDSMGGAISPYLQQAYSPTWQVGVDYSSFAGFPDYRALVAQHHPDVVIYQFAERHLISAPPFGAAY